MNPSSILDVNAPITNKGANNHLYNSKSVKKTDKKPQYILNYVNNILGTFVDSRPIQFVKRIPRKVIQFIRKYFNLNSENDKIKQCKQSLDEYFANCKEDKSLLDLQGVPNSRKNINVENAVSRSLDEKVIIKNLENNGIIIDEKVANYIDHYINNEIKHDEYKLQIENFLQYEKEQYDHLNLRSIENKLQSGIHFFIKSSEKQEIVESAIDNICVQKLRKQGNQYCTGLDFFTGIKNKLPNLSRKKKDEKLENIQTNPILKNEQIEKTLQYFSKTLTDYHIVLNKESLYIENTKIQLQENLDKIKSYVSDIKFTIPLKPSSCFKNPLVVMSVTNLISDVKQALNKLSLDDTNSFKNAQQIIMGEILPSLGRSLKLEKNLPYYPSLKLIAKNVQNNFIKNTDSDTKVFYNDENAFNILFGLALLPDECRDQIFNTISDTLK